MHGSFSVLVPKEKLPPGFQKSELSHGSVTCCFGTPLCGLLRTPVLLKLDMFSMEQKRKLLERGLKEWEALESILNLVSIKSL